MKDKLITRFEKRHKIISFTIILLATILTTRFLVKFADINPIITGFELHHFYYGLILLIIISLIMLFKRGNFLLNLFLVSTSLGLIVDEIVFIGTKVRGPLEYNSTFSSAIIFAIIVLLIVEAIFYGLKKNEKRN